MIKDILDKLLHTPESEIVEFKEAKKSYDFSKLGKYFSALSNEANLKGVKSAWLVFGVNNDRKIVSTSYRANFEDRQSLKKEIADKTTSRITFIEIYEVLTNGDGNEKRVLLFEIPAAPKAMPVAFEGVYWGRDGESLDVLNIDELERIRSQNTTADWSGEIVEKATIADLDEEAIFKARQEYKEKNKNNKRLTPKEIDAWSVISFLDKARVTKNGKITNAAIILLGKADSVKFLKDSVAKITWILKDANGIEIDYVHFSVPFILNVDNVLSKIRNITFRSITGGTLFPDETNQYDNYVIREALHNCIAHQDYSLRQRINVVEFPDVLIFSNGGKFLPQTIENVIEQDSPSRYYANEFLCDAMVNLNMIDTIGSGIKKMFLRQKERYFPMPDYVIKENESVTVKIYGKVIDYNYVSLLQNKPDISLTEVIWLDRVQKKLEITEFAIKELRKRGLIDGRKPNFYIAESIAKATGELDTFVKNKAFDKRYYKDLIISFLTKKQHVTRPDIDKLLWDKLSNVLDDNKKANFVRNLLYEMNHKDNSISNEKREWFLTKDKNKN